jgi:hypothetical protein
MSAAEACRRPRGGDLIVVPVNDECRHVELREVAAEVRRREGSDALGRVAMTGCMHCSQKLSRVPYGTFAPGRLLPKKYDEHRLPHIVDSVSVCRVSAAVPDRILPLVLIIFVVALESRLVGDSVSQREGACLAVAGGS